ncbi:hypothetical protein [Geobacter sp.]|uniref:hypothetical protein n=1 Tax=Geobacter sp. TaxID=46610 RepID=UPI00260DDF32|nr:hypothetical protein [Geobacter sp.]
MSTIARRSVMALLGLAAALAAGTAMAANDAQNLTINATVSAAAKLSLDAAAISFASADADSTPSIPSSPAAVNITAKAKTGSSQTVTLTVQSGGDLTSGTDVIPISQVTWTSGSGGGWSANGTMSKSAPQTVASWTGSGSRTGSNSYALANSWDYATGSYTAVTTYTLTSP